jgi:serine phosphatase RsbU (regulator of sigma subunit)
LIFRIIMKYLIFIFILSLIVASSGISQECSYSLTNYTTKEYGRDFNPANSAIVQDKRGIIYAANGFKLLEFDGHLWNSFPINKQAWIISLAVDSSGIIYAGSQNEFGYFAPDPVKGLNYISLSDSLNINDMNFTNVWKVHAFSGGIVFQAEEKIFIFKNGKTEVVKPETSFHTSFIVNDKLYVRERGKGLMVWEENSLKKISGGELFENSGIFLMLPFGTDRKEILIGTQENGFWLLDNSSSSKTIRPFPASDINLLNESKVTGGVLTGDGSIAVGTLLNGVITIDKSGIIKSVINQKSGLADNQVKQVISDNCGNLWLALNNGICRVEISSPLSFYSEKSGITGSINALTRYNDMLYIGTSSGLLVQRSKSKFETGFIKAFNLSSPIRSLTVVDEKLLVATDAGLFIVTKNGIQKIGSEESFTFWYSPEMKILLSGGPKGLTVYLNNGSFRKLDLFREIKDDIIGISGNKAGNPDSCQIWIGTRYSGAIRINLFKDFSYKIEHFGVADGVSAGPILPFRYNDTVVFGTSEGLFSFIDENAVKQTLPDSLKNNKEFQKGYFSFFPLYGDSSGKPISSLAGSINKVWICSDNTVGYFDTGNVNVLIKQPFRGIDAGKINVIYPEENGLCWIGTTDGLIRFDENKDKRYDNKYSSVIRRVSGLRNDSLFFAGINYEKDSTGFRIVTDQPQSLEPSLSFRNNSLRFDFAAPFFEYMDKIRFSCKLEGYDSKWSEPENKYYKEYTNLPEGDYAFRVKAINVYGTESNEAEYSFKILPPWYRTRAAFIFYGISAIILVWLIVRLYSYRLKQENLRLEGIVVERTAEVVRQKDEIEKKNIVLEYQKKEIEDSIRYARRIQTAVIPSEQDFNDYLPDGFVFFRPLGIVSGDFYWMSHIEKKLIITVADCTGHGVPGAFMSMLGVAFLNEIVNKDQVTEPDIILNRLREKVISALQQQGITGEARDGMDISIVCIDGEKKKLQYAGAFNPLISIRKGELIETEADRMPIAIYDIMHPFKKNEITLEKGDIFYIFSDGFIDQFGGPDGKKINMKRFKNLLLDIHKHPIKMQKEMLNRSFDEWKGDLQQVDDVTIIGIAIK